MILDAWHRFRDGTLMSNDLRGERDKQDRLAAERIARQADMARRQRELNLHAKRPRAS